MAVLTHAASHALIIIAFALICCSAGRALIDRFLPACPVGQRIAFSIALGTGLVGQALFLLGIAGQLTRTSVAIVLAIAAAVGFPPIRDAARTTFDRRRAFFAGAAVLATGGPSFLLALYPPVGFDATMYHLPYARLFAEQASLVFADTLRFPVFPQLGEMPFAAALLLSDDVTAHLTQWLALMVTTLTIASMARELESRFSAMLAIALWIGSPLALYLGANAYIDMSLAMFVTLAFAAWHRWQREGHQGWAMLAGAFAGCAAATKYHGLFFIAVLFLALLWRNRRAAAFFTLCALLFAAPWYVRIASATGNPLFPYFSAIFGRHEWQTVFDAGLESSAANPVQAIARVPVNPFSSMLDRALIGRVRDRQAPFNPWLLLGLPFAIVTAWRDRRQRFPIAIALVYAIVVSPLDWRFMIAIVPILAVGIAGGILRVGSSFRAPSFALVTVVAFAFAAPGLVWMALLLRSFGAIPTSQAKRDAFLTRRVPVYDALHFLGRARVPPTAYLFHAENANYYCPARCMGEVYGPYRQQLLEPLARRPELLAERLRGFGAEVVVLPKGERTAGLIGQMQGSSAFRPIFSSGRSEVFAVGDGAARRP